MKAKTKAAPKAKRPPRQVWVVIDDRGNPRHVTSTKGFAGDLATALMLTVAGPYVLAERVRQR